MFHSLSACNGTSVTSNEAAASAAWAAQYSGEARNAWRLAYRSRVERESSFTENISWHARTWRSRHAAFEQLGLGFISYVGKKS